MDDTLNNLSDNLSDRVRDNGDSQRNSDYTASDIQSIQTWGFLRARYGKPLFQKAIGKQMMILAGLRDREVVTAYLNGEDFSKHNSPTVTYKGCNFARGKMQGTEDYKRMIMKVDRKNTLTIPFDTLITVASIDALLDLSKQPLLQFTFYNIGQNGEYLVDIIDRDSIAASKNVLTMLAKEHKIYEPIHLKEIQIPEQGHRDYLFNSEYGPNFKYGLMFKKKAV
jgi:hypothetical protein